MRLLLAIPILLWQEATEPLRLGREEFTSRRAALAERFPGAAIVLDAGPLKEPGDDANTPVLDFRYLAGIHLDDGLMVIKDGRAHLFTGDAARPGAFVDETHGLADFPAWAAENLSGRRKVVAKLRGPNMELLKRGAPDAEIVSGPLRDELVRMRLRKSAAEIRCIKKASEVTCAALRKAARALRPGMNERDIQEIILEAFKTGGCPEIGFPPIIGAGMNGTILHYHENDKEIRAGSLLLCDVGAACEGYSTDITRTFPASGRFDPEQRKQYQCVLDAMKAAEAALRPGASFGDLERAARAVFEERGLRKWSFAHSKDFSVRHGIGHYVGLNVHDSGTYGEKFAPGMVITIEPGWYDKDAGYGIRIEDIYLVTEEGYERLSAGIPREPDEVERAVGPGRDY